MHILMNACNMSYAQGEGKCFQKEKKKLVYHYVTLTKYYSYTLIKSSYFKEVLI